MGKAMSVIGPFGKLDLVQLSDGSIEIQAEGKPVLCLSLRTARLLGMALKDFVKDLTVPDALP